MKCQLIVLTNTFPYGSPRESFLEEECKYYPENTIIIPRIKMTGDVRRFEHLVVDNWMIKLTSNSPFFSKVLIFSLGLFSILSWKQIFIIPLNFNFIVPLKKVISFVGEAKLIAWNVEKILKKDKKNIIYSYWFHQSALALGLLKKKFPDIKTVSRAHGLELYKNKHTENIQFLMNYMSQYIDIVVSISSNGKKHLETLYSAKYIENSYLGIVDNGLISKISNIKELHIVSCSFIYPVKRLHLLVDSIEQYARTSELLINWTHLGGENQTAGKLKELEVYAEKAYINLNNMRFSLLGSLNNSEIYDYYKKNCVDVFINTSESEGLPVSMMEAMSFGIPIIGTDVGGVSELIGENEGCLLNKDYSMGEFVDAINHILLFKEKKKREVIRNRFKKRFRADINYRYFVDNILYGS